MIGWAYCFLQKFLVLNRCVAIVRIEKKTNLQSAIYEYIWFLMCRIARFFKKNSVYQKVASEKI